MKSTGIIRKIDDLGRIVIPKDMRRQLDIMEGDSFEIFLDTTGGPEIEHVVGISLRKFLLEKDIKSDIQRIMKNIKDECYGDRASYKNLMEVLEQAQRIVS